MGRDVVGGWGGGGGGGAKEQNLDWERGGGEKRLESERQTETA